MKLNIEYKITTIKELVEVASVNNINNLMTDLRNFITIIKKFGPEAQIDASTFNWIDDGEANLSIISNLPEDEIWNDKTRDKFIESLSSITTYNKATNILTISNEIRSNDIIGTGKVTIKLPDINTEDNI
jgi:hypothetical protein